MSPIKIARRKRIFSPLCLIKTEHNKGKRNRECVVLTISFQMGLQPFYCALLIIMHIQVVYRSEVRQL